MKSYTQKTNLYKFSNTLEGLCWLHNQQGGTVHQFNKQYETNFSNWEILEGQSPVNNKDKRRLNLKHRVLKHALYKQHIMVPITVTLTNSQPIDESVKDILKRYR